MTQKSHKINILLNFIPLHKRGFIFFYYICTMNDKKTKKTVEQKKFERTYEMEDCVMVWKYDNYKTNTGPYEVEIKQLKKKV